MRFVYIGIDQGSSSTKAVLLDQDSCELRQLNIPVALSREDGLHVEQDPEELLRSVLQALDELLNYCTQHDFNPKAIGLACQRSGVLAFEPGTGRALSALLTWRDRSAQSEVEALSAHAAARIKAISSLPLIPDYAGPKIALLQRRFPHALVATLDTFLMYRLSQGQCYLTDDSMAARSLLYDLQAGEWSAEACALLGVDSSRLPHIVASASPLTSPRLTYRGIPLSASIGDTQASFYACYAQGQQAVLNLGTLGSLCFALSPGQPFPDGCVNSVWYSTLDVQDSQSRGRCFLSEIVHFSCGGLLQELQRLLSQRGGCKRSLQELAALASAASAEGPVLFHAPRGEATPTWRLHLATIISNPQELSDASLARAFIENVAFGLACGVEHVRAQGIKVDQALALGGACDCEIILQWLAQASQLDVHRGELRQGSAHGAALVARFGVETLSFAQRDVVCVKPTEPKVFATESAMCNSPPDRVVQERYALWRALREQALTGKGDYSELSPSQCDQLFA